MVEAMMTKEECEKRAWPHGYNRCRWTHGFECYDCGSFFPRDSITFKRYEYPSTLWMAIWNTGAGDKPKCTDRKEIDRLIKVCDKMKTMPEEKLLATIAQMEKWLRDHGTKDADKATGVVLGGK